jgi:hypothetical protein
MSDAERRVDPRAVFFMHCVYIEQQERSMQKRFCLCGQAVWVHYLFIGRLWRTLFAKREEGQAVRTCPGCGMPLSIHSLR